MRTVRYILIAVLVAACGALAAAQGPIGQTDLSRLDATAAEVDRAVTAGGQANPSAAAEAKSLAELRDDIAYLRVKLRREGAVSQSEYSDVRTRLEALRARVQGPPIYAQPVLSPDEPARVVPVGTEIDVRLQTPLSSRTARVEGRFEATTLMDLKIGGAIAVPAGTVVRGFVSSVRAAGKVDRRGSLTLSFDEMMLAGRVVRLRATVQQALDPKINDDVSRIGAGAVVGAVIGGILGGAKGALVGVLIGGGGTIASTEGSDVDLPVGTVLRIRIDQPVDVGPS